VATVNRMLSLLASVRTSENVKARLLFSLGEIEDFITKRENNTMGKSFEFGTYQLILYQIKQFKEHPEEFKLAEPLPMPDGSPIGDFDGL
jgi:hypothetical protein